MKTTAKTQAILQALLVTLLWSTSWILIKFFLVQIPPLVFAGLRYAFAFLILLPGMVRHLTLIRSLSARRWLQLFLLGLVYIAFTQGGQFLTLQYLPTTTLSLLLNFSSLVVAFVGIYTLDEQLSARQWLGLLVFLLGVLLYFWRGLSFSEYDLGYLLAGLTVLANAAASIMSRSINRARDLPPVIITGLSFAFGSVLLLLPGFIFEGLPTLDWQAMIVILWLAAVNTALAFTLWNKTLQTLTAVESSILNNSMLIQIAFLSWIFLGDQISALELAGILLAMLGIIVVQIPKK